MISDEEEALADDRVTDRSASLPSVVAVNLGTEDVYIISVVHSQADSQW